MQVYEANVHLRINSAEVILNQNGVLKLFAKSKSPQDLQEVAIIDKEIYYFLSVVTEADIHTLQKTDQQDDTNNVSVDGNN